MKRPQPWNMASVRQRQAPRKPYKPVGPVGPDIVVYPSHAGALVNGVPLTAKKVFSLGVDVPELGISAYGPHGPEAGRRGDGIGICKGCGYALCSCPPKLVVPSPTPEPRPMTIDWPAVRAELRRLEAERHAALPSPMPEPPASWNGPLSNASLMPEPPKPWQRTPLLGQLDSIEPPLTHISETGQLSTLRDRMAIANAVIETMSPAERKRAINLLLTGDADGEAEGP
jgi:hypothetical protein